MRQCSVVDLYCGVGGLTHGFVQEGFNVVAGIDVDESCKYAYEKNNGASFLAKSVDTIEVGTLKKLYPRGHVKILVGCAPCRPFSKYSIKKRAYQEWKLVLRFAEIVQAVRPDVVSMENVPALAEHHVFKTFLDVLEKAKYEYSWQAVECVRYGVPQTRTRLVLLASKLGDIRLLRPTHSGAKYRSVRDAIGNLEPLKAGMTDANDPLHHASALSPLNMVRIASTPAGGGWKDWPDDLVLDCHKSASGQTYRSIYGRMRWDLPAPTMTTQCNGLGNGRFGHPDQNRAISLREAALIQTFPKRYDFIDPHSRPSIKKLAQQIGNAVPVRLGRIIARSIRTHLEEHLA
jgi:DNA (cytosine-5)-methyltransferase 1